MEHVLDNPAWSALISGNKHLSNGNEQVKYFDKEVSPFAAMKDNSADSFGQLYEAIPHNSPILIITPAEMEIPAPWKVLRCIKGFQMVCEAEIKPLELQTEILPLTDEHIAQMLALTQLTDPGPFVPRTIEFGHYKGIFDGDKLAAMAGQRMHAFNYAEISAVCTHPDYLGKGYAKQLLVYHINRIRAASEIPFLHVRHDNDRAIRVYQSLGFYTRKEIWFNVLLKTINT